MNMPVPRLFPSIATFVAVEPSINRELVLAPNAPFWPGFSGGNIPAKVIVLLAGRLKLMLADPPDNERRFAWLRQYRKSPLAPLPAPRPVGFASVVAFTVNV
jgi:hypothetical protein